jgi:predicted acylesterase/phospholipase RssA
MGQAMSELGECRCLDASILEGRNVLPGATEINRWLSTEEERHDILVLEAGPAPDAWSDLALRHADSVVLIADMTRSSRRTEIENHIDRRRELHSSRRFLMLVREDDTAQPEGTESWLTDRRLDGILHVRGRQRSDIARAARLATGRGTGLVLGGGGARGFAHIGVYQALCELGVAVDWVGGTSIGAVFGAGIALGASPDEIVTRAREAFVRGKPFGDVTVPAVSLLKGKRMERLTQEMLPGQIEDLPTPFFCLATNLGRAETEIYDRGSIWRALRASTALPGVFPPAVMNKQLVVDGGVLNNLPVDIMRRKPVDTIIAVDLSSHKEREVDYDAVPSAMRLLVGRWLPFTRRPAVPGIMSLMLKGQELGSLVHARENRKLADLVLRPPVGHHEFADVRPFDRIVRAGYDDAREQVGRWLADRDGRGLAMPGKHA